MDTLKVVKSPLGGYLGVYHTSRAEAHGEGRDQPGPAALDFEANLASDGSTPTIYRLARRSSLVAYESPSGCGGPGHCLALRTTRASRRCSTAPRRSLVLPRKLSTLRGGNAQHLAATANLSRIQLGFHYFATARSTARRAAPCRASTRGLVREHRAQPRQAIIAAGASPDGNIGDRDGGFYDGAIQRLYEGQLAPPTSARGATSCLSAARRRKLDDPHSRRLAWRSPTRPSLRCACRAGSPAWSSRSSCRCRARRRARPANSSTTARGTRRARRGRTRRSRPPATSRARRTTCHDDETSTC